MQSDNSLRLLSSVLRCLAGIFSRISAGIRIEVPLGLSSLALYRPNVLAASILALLILLIDITDAILLIKSAALSLKGVLS